MQLNVCPLDLLLKCDHYVWHINTIDLLLQVITVLSTGIHILCYIYSLYTASIYQLVVRAHILITVLMFTGVITVYSIGFHLVLLSFTARANQV